MDDDWVGEVIRDNIQHLTMKFSKNNIEILITLVYARCDIMERMELWEELEMLANDFALPWMVGGDFNVIRNVEEMRGA